MRSNLGSNAERDLPEIIYGTMKSAGLLIAFSAQIASAQHKPGYCNVCRETPAGQSDRYISNPSHSFEMQGVTWTCAYLQSTVQDVDPFHGAPGEARWCSLTQTLAEAHCQCGGPSIPPISDNIHDLNPKCDICHGQALDFVPAGNADLLTAMPGGGHQNCAGLYHAAAHGIFSDSMCHKVQPIAGPTCCNIKGPGSVSV